MGHEGRESGAGAGADHTSIYWIYKICAFLPLRDTDRILAIIDIKRDFYGG